MLKVTVRGGKKSSNWYLKWIDPRSGKECRASTRTKNQRTATKLKERKAEELEDIVMGRVDEAEANSDVDPLAALPDYLSACDFRGNTKGIVKQKKSRLQLGLDFCSFGTMEVLLRDGKKQLVKFLIQLKTPAGKQIAASTRDNYAALFKTFGQYLESESLIPLGSNPFVGIPKIGNASNTVNNPSYLLRSEISKLVEASRSGFGGDRQARRILVFTQTGLRHDEARNFVWADIVNRHVVVRASNAKSRKERRIPISTALQEVLDQEYAAQCAELGEAPKPTDAVLKMQRGSHPMIDRMRVDALTAGLVDDAGYRPDNSRITVHALRHSSLTWLAETMPLHHVQAIAGHADIKMTLKYVRIDHDEMLKGVEDSSRRYTAQCNASDNHSDSTSQTRLKLVVGA